VIVTTNATLQSILQGTCREEQAYPSPETSAARAELHVADAQEQERGDNGTEQGGYRDKTASLDSDCVSKDHFAAWFPVYKNASGDVCVKNLNQAGVVIKARRDTRLVGRETCPHISARLGTCFGRVQSPRSLVPGCIFVLAFEISRHAHISLLLGPLCVCVCVCVCVRACVSCVCVCVCVLRESARVRASERGRDGERESSDRLAPDRLAPRIDITVGWTYSHNTVGVLSDGHASAPERWWRDSEQRESVHKREGEGGAGRGGGARV
jgi:hypothetical protein